MQQIPFKIKRKFVPWGYSGELQIEIKTKELKNLNLNSSIKKFISEIIPSDFFTNKELTNIKGFDGEDNFQINGLNYKQTLIHLSGNITEFLEEPIKTTEDSSNQELLPFTYNLHSTFAEITSNLEIKHLISAQRFGLPDFIDVHQINKYDLISCNSLTVSLEFYGYTVLSRLFRTAPIVVEKLFFHLSAENGLKLIIETQAWPNKDIKPYRSYNIYPLLSDYLESNFGLKIINEND